MRQYKIKTIWIVIGITLCLLLGFAMGVGIGMQKGQYMLFEGLNKAFKGAEVNVEIDLNETEIINGINETLVPAFKEMLKEEVEQDES